jgi:hypothetical protein
MVTTKKNEVTINGITFEQNFDDLSLIKNYITWKTNVEGISGDSIGVNEENIPTLWDFLDNHIFGNIRDESVNQGFDGNGATKVLDSLESILEGRVLNQAEFDEIKDLYKHMEDMKDNSGFGDRRLDPRTIAFTEKTYDRAGQVSGEKDLLGHFKTPEYVKRMKAKGKDIGEAVNSGWYSGTGNPPSFALFGGNDTYAKPKGLIYILEDFIKEIEQKGGAELPTDIGRLNSQQAQKLAGVASIEKYFNRVIQNEAFWKGGKLLVGKLNNDVATQVFPVTKKEADMLVQVFALGDKQPIGRIREIKVSLTGAPLIEMTHAALLRANTKKGADDFRAWTPKGQFDYRKTRREAYGEDAQGNLDAKVISKMWQQILWRD